MGFWRRYRFPLAIISLLLAALTIFSLNAGSDPSETVGGRLMLEVVGPFQGAADTVGDFIGGIWRSYFALVHASRQNQELQAELDLMRQRLVRMEEYREANDRLRALLGLKSRYNYPLIAAEVVAVDPAAHFRTAVINKGSADHVMSHMPVIHNQGVVGRVVWSSPNYAKVLFITDPNSGVDVLVQRSRARGIVEGMGPELMRLKYVRHNMDVRVGDRLITSGAAGVFPSGVLVGTVRSVQKKGRGMFQSVEVEPAVNLERLEEVLVVLRSHRFKD